MKLSLGLGRENKRIFWAALFEEGGFGIMMTLLPLYIASLGANAAQIGLVLGAAGIMRIGLLTMSGMLTDSIPPRKLIVGTRVIGVIGFLLIGLSQTWWHVMLGMMVVAATTVGWPAISNLVAGDSRQGRPRMRAFTMIYTIAPSAALLFAPALGGVIADNLGLRLIFVAAAALKLVSVGFFLTLTEQATAKSTGYRGSLMNVLRHGPIRTVTLFAFATIFVLAMGLVLLPNYLHDVHEVGMSEIGLLGSLSAMGAITLGILINRVSWFQRPHALLPMVVAAVGLGYLLIVVGQSYWIFALAFIFRSGFVVAWSLFYAILGDITPEKLRSRVYVLAELLGEGGYSLAPIFAGVLYGLIPAGPTALAVVLSFPLVGGLIWLRNRIDIAAAADAAPSQSEMAYGDAELSLNTGVFSN